jgi:hypothetical protein
MKLDKNKLTKNEEFQNKTKPMAQMKKGQTIHHFLVLFKK